MPRFVTRAPVAIALLLATSACTQPASMVELEGHKFFAKNGVQSKPYFSYAPASGRTSYTKSYSAPVSMATSQAASTDSISVSEVAPPPPSVQVSEPAPVVAAAPEPVKQPEIQKAEVQKINPWTKKPREEFVAANENKPAAADAKTKPVVLSVDRASKSSFIWPVNGTKVISSYGPKGGGKANDGINIAAASGEPVWATADGEVIYVGNELAGYGNMILIKHAGDKTTTYAHLGHTTVEKYDHVAQGDIIGYVGQTGSVNKPQLHFAVREGKDFVDPTKVVSRSLASN